VDWEVVRDQIDNRIKRLLYAQRYGNENLTIQASYPLGRITVQYENHLGQNDSYKIETGYMRRIPILPTDSLETFRHIATGEELPVKTPQSEELYANKWCTLLYRGSSRDLFDIYRISKSAFRRDTFKKCAVIDSLMRGQPRLHEIDIEKLVESIPIDTALRNLPLKDISKYDFKLVRKDVKEFSQRMIRQLTADEKSVINRFYEEKEFDPEPMEAEGILNRNITAHPMIRWALKQL